MAIEYCMEQVASTEYIFVGLVSGNKLPLLSF
jgi:hypothetical protein